jgi:hypothetical protein
MLRTQFYHRNVVDNVPELDFLWNPLSGFVMKYEPMHYRITVTDLVRPETISYKCYGVVDFWWIIMLVNGLNNPFTDLMEGEILQIPNRLDIYDFHKKNRIVE